MWSWPKIASVLDMTMLAAEKPPWKLHVLQWAPKNKRSSVGVGGGNLSNDTRWRTSNGDGSLPFANNWRWKTNDTNTLTCRWIGNSLTNIVFRFTCIRFGGIYVQWIYIYIYRSFENYRRMECYQHAPSTENNNNSSRRKKTTTTIKIDLHERKNTHRNNTLYIHCMN